MNLITDYSRALDDRELEDLPVLFDDDIELRLRDGTFYRGREAAEELTKIAAVAVRHRHIVTNVRVNVEDDDHAAARSDWYLTNPTEGRVWEIEDVGTYDDRFIKRDGRWRLTSRTIESAPR